MKEMDQANPGVKGWKPFATAENAVICAALVAMMLVPPLEIVLRRFFGTGIKGASDIVQHLTLLLGMAGAAVAARQNRLLSLSTLGASLKGRLNTWGRLFASGVAVAIAALLSIGAVFLVRAEREAGSLRAYRVPTWLLELALPIGFAAIAVYLMLHSADRWGKRLVAVAVAIAAVWMVISPPSAPQGLVVPALLALGAATLLGVPVFVTLGGVAVILFWGTGQPIASIAVSHYSLVTDPSMPTVPLFTLAGYALAEGGAPKRLVRVFRALLGHLTGSSVIATVLLSAFFTTFTGASGITILAIGGLLMPVLLADGYREKTALGLVTSAGSLGLLFPPCLPLILYAIIAHVPMEQMFLGGILPGFVMVAATGSWGLLHRPKRQQAGPTFKWSEARGALWGAKWELLLPVVVMVSLFSGWATPVESAAVTALYALFVETFVYRDLNLIKDVPRVMTECGLLVGGVLLILGVALGFTNYLVDVDFTQHAVDWIATTIKSPLMFLLVLNLWLLVVGCLMDIYSAIVIQVPLLVPIAMRFDIDPIHMGIIFLANLEIGYLTPPVGLNLFMSSFRFRKPLAEVTRATAPIAVVLLLAVLVITYVPFLSTWLPNRFTR